MSRIGPRRGPSRTRSSTPDDLVAVAFDDAVLDRLAARSRRSEEGRCPRWTADGSTDWISDQFAKWQDRLIRPAAPAVMDADRAAALVASAPRRSSLRPALAVVAAICALLIGSAVVGARSARPGDPLFPVTQVFWSDQADSAVAGEEVRGAIDAARDALRVGRTAHAAVLLTRASVGLARISDQTDHAAVQRELDAAWDLLAAVSAHATAAATPQPSWADAVSAAGDPPAGLPVQAAGAPATTSPPTTGSAAGTAPAAVAPAVSSAAGDEPAGATPSGGPSTTEARPGPGADTASSTTEGAQSSSVAAAPPPPATGTSGETTAPATSHEDDQTAPTTSAPTTSAVQKPSTSATTAPSTTTTTTPSTTTTTAPTTTAPLTTSTVADDPAEAQADSIGLSAGNGLVISSTPTLSATAPATSDALVVAGTAGTSTAGATSTGTQDPSVEAN